jgi:hypothetical protein
MEFKLSEQLKEKAFYFDNHKSDFTKRNLCQPQVLLQECLNFLNVFLSEFDLKRNYKFLI